MIDDTAGTPPPFANKSMQSVRVLLVDDHGLFLEGLRNLLNSEGIQVVGMARDGLDALAQCRHLRPDIILMDIQMPRCDGVTATRLIKAEMPECKIVMLTMSDEDNDLFEAVKSGASGYLLKRLDASDFFMYLNDLLTGHIPFSPGLAEKILKEFTQKSMLYEQSGSSAADKDGGSSQQAAIGDLTPRQWQILTLVAQGQTYRQAAATIGLSERTIKYHMSEIFNHLHLKNRAEVIAYAARRGISRHNQAKD